MEFKKLSDVEVVAEPTESANVLIEENGVIKKAPKTAVGGGEWDAIIDLGADIEGESVCALWSENYVNARFILGGYDTIIKKFNNNEIPNILCYGTAQMYDDFYTFKSEVCSITIDPIDSTISLGYHAFNLCGYSYAAYIVVDRFSNFLYSNNEML